MKISTKGRYALRVLVDLAEHRSDEFVALKTMAERQNISKKYLEQIVPLLNRGGLLITGRGYQGGYKLSKRPDQITVGEVLRLTEGDLEPVTCLIGGHPEQVCERAADCPTLPVWQGLSKTINNYLDSITIQDIVDQTIGSSGNNYVI